MVDTLLAAQRAARRDHRSTRRAAARRDSASARSGVRAVCARRVARAERRASRKDRRHGSAHHRRDRPSWERQWQTSPVPITERAACSTQRATGSLQRPNARSGAQRCLCAGSTGLAPGRSARARGARGRKRAQGRRRATGVTRRAPPSQPRSNSTTRRSATTAHSKNAEPPQSRLLATASVR